MFLHDLFHSYSDARPAPGDPQDDSKARDVDMLIECRVIPWDTVAEDDVDMEPEVEVEGEPMEVEDTSIIVRAESESHRMDTITEPNGRTSDVVAQGWSKDVRDSTSNSSSANVANNDSVGLMVEDAFEAEEEQVCFASFYAIIILLNTIMWQNDMM